MHFFETFMSTDSSKCCVPFGFESDIIKQNQPLGVMLLNFCYKAHTRGLLSLTGVRCNKYN